jgi:ubiquinone/menaquinone biosynthesis C-methylase UbiE
VWSALPAAVGPASYERSPALYDRLIPSRLYNRLAWSTVPADYVAFAREAVADADGPLLDAAGGSAVFTADVYRSAQRPVVLSDLSLGMLERARTRLAGAEDVTLVQADATDPPFAPGAFPTVACMSAVHVFPDPAPVVRALWRLVAPGGRLFLSGLVSETRVASAYLRLLQRAGEVGPPLTLAELTEVVGQATGAPARLRRRGAMAYLVVSA